MSNDVVPWNAATFFGEPGKWEPILSNGTIACCVPSLELDGSVTCPNLWQGMRRKKVKRTVGVWMNLYPDGDRVAYENKRRADECCAERRLGGKAHYVEIEIEE